MQRRAAGCLCERRGDARGREPRTLDHDAGNLPWMQHVPATRWAKTRLTSPCCAAHCVGESIAHACNLQTRPCAKWDRSWLRSTRMPDSHLQRGRRRASSSCSPSEARVHRLLALCSTTLISRQAAVLPPAWTETSGHNQGAQAQVECQCRRAAACLYLQAMETSWHQPCRQAAHEACQPTAFCMTLSAF